MVEDKVQIIESLEGFLSAEGTEYKVIEGFGPGKQLRIGSVTAGDIIEWGEANEGKAKRTAGLRLILKSVCNSSGQRILDDSKNLEAMKKLPHKVANRIVKDILELNGMNVVEGKKSTKAEDDAKND